MQNIIEIDKGFYYAANEDKTKQVWARKLEDKYLITIYITTNNGKTNSFNNLELFTNDIEKVKKQMRFYL